MVDSDTQKTVISLFYWLLHIISWVVTDHVDKYSGSIFMLIISVPVLFIYFLHLAMM